MSRFYLETIPLYAEKQPKFPRSPRTTCVRQQFGESQRQSVVQCSEVKSCILTTPAEPPPPRPQINLTFQVKRKIHL